MPENELPRRLQWFLLLRVGMTTFLLLAATVLYYSGDGNNIAVSKPLFFASIITNAISVTSGLLLTRVQGLALFAYIQLGFDTLFTTGVILLTGGLYSPFVFLYHLAILNAAILLRRRGALAAATFAALCYGGTVDLLYYGVFPPSGFSPVLFFVDFTPPGFNFTVQLLVTLSSFYAIAALGSHLTQRVSNIEQLLTERGITTQRLSSLYQGAMQSLENGIVLANNAGQIEYANDILGKLIGAAPHRLTGREVAEILPLPHSQLATIEPVEFSLRKAEGEVCVLRVLRSSLH